MINISNYSKAEVLAALYNNSKPLGMGYLHFTPEDMTTAVAQGFIGQRQAHSADRIYFDYLKGRVMKVDLSTNELDPFLYDRDNGPGAARRAIDAIKTKTKTG